MIKVFLKLRSLKQRAYGRLTNHDETWVSTKIKNYSFSLKELVELDEFTDTYLAFIDKETGEIIIQIDKEIDIGVE